MTMFCFWAKEVVVLELVEITSPQDTGLERSYALVYVGFSLSAAFLFHSDMLIYDVPLPPCSVS